eukprot:211189_1
MPLFIMLIIISGGCYPSILFISSGMFGLGMFQSGLTKRELDKLSKIKIKATIICENGPQILIQIIYAWAIFNVNGDWNPSPAVVFAFVGSSLSVLMAVASYYAVKNIHQDSNVMDYYLRFENMKKREMSIDDKNNIVQRKGRKRELTKSIVKTLSISEEAMQIGYVWINNNGLEMHISHFVSKAELAKHRKKGKGFISEITPVQYLLKLYASNEVKENMNRIFRRHFNIGDPDFIVQFVMDNMVTSGLDGDDDENRTAGPYGTRSVPTPQHQLVEMQEMMRTMQKMMDARTNDDRNVDVELALDDTVDVMSGNDVVAMVNTIKTQ